MKNPETNPVQYQEEDFDTEYTRIEMCSPCDKPCQYIETEGLEAWKRCYDQQYLDNN